MDKIQVECFVFRKGYEFLLLKRIPEKGNFWQPPCGRMEESDKTILDAAYREVFEETKISKGDIIKVIDNVHYFEVDKHYITNKPIPKIKEYVIGFKVKSSTKVSISSNIYPEHSEFVWVDFETALKLLKWEDNKEGLRRLFKKIRP